jgi:ribose 1,5-bisphosphokinase
MPKILLIVGASGVGKDTLLRAIKGEIEANFLQRYINRAPSKDEQNYYVDSSAFALLQEHNFFISSWAAHENRYGIAKSHIKEGLNIISISRGAVADFERVYHNVVTIEVTIPKETLYKRLKSRGRESEEQIQKRIERSNKSVEAKRLLQFINDKDLESSKKEFIELIKGIKWS